MKASKELTHDAHMSDPRKLPQLGSRSAHNSIRIRRTANFINFAPICLSVGPNCTIIHQHDRNEPGKRENFLYKRHCFWLMISGDYESWKAAIFHWAIAEMRQAKLVNGKKSSSRGSTTNANCSFKKRSYSRVERSTERETGRNTMHAKFNFPRFLFVVFIALNWIFLDEVRARRRD